MCLYRALNLYCSSPCNIGMKDVAEKCDQGAEQEPNISTDIYSVHIWWLVAGGRCGHTLKINTNNARSSIPYTPYSYTLYTLSDITTRTVESQEFNMLQNYPRYSCTV